MQQHKRGAVSRPEIRPSPSPSSLIHFTAVRINCCTTSPTDHRFGLGEKAKLIPIYADGLVVKFMHSP
ncbi:hypothetical protein M5D96_003948 [Drosophila gunungcola]|uniref:Uncharacterized protein n=1 Tax=Drosophila gunungcola TaxID=103775 RepID=A0A9Q0BSX4_9MUSC|nr:hypothetical protein M5D96_003948 [Drosophila gunungcola]